LLGTPRFLGMPAPTRGSIGVSDHTTKQAGRRPAHAARAALLASVAGAPLVWPAVPPAFAQAPQPALPTGGRVVAGGATITAPAPGQIQINQTTPRAAIDWQSFSVGQGGQVQFQQPSASAFALNRVTGPDASVIAGRITANGQIAIVNQSGIVFTPTARVDVGALVASAANISNENFMAGRMVFDGPPRPGAQVVNEGRITVAEGGLAALVAPQAANRGTIEARLGRVVIGGAETFALDLHGDGLIALEVARPTMVTQGPAASNTGTIAAEGGTVLITAEAAGQLVQSLVEAGGTVNARNGGRVSVAARGGEARVTGTIDATSATGRGGDVALSGRQVAVAPTGRIDASGATGGGRVRIGGDVQGSGTMPRAERTTVAQGSTVRADATVAGDGGTVVVWADDAAFVHGALSARGGPQGGNGGFIETSGLATLSLAGISVDAGAPSGRSGTWLIDPFDLTIGVATANGSFVNGVFTPSGGVSAATLSASDLATALEGTNVTLTTTSSGAGTGTITVAQPVFWGNDPDFPATTTLTLNAVGDIVINAPIYNPVGSLVLNAGSSHSITQSGTGTITVSRLAATAGRDITLASSGNGISEVTALTSSTGSISLASGSDLLVTGAASAQLGLSLAAPDISTTPAGVLSAGPGQTLTLRASTLTLAAEAAAPGGRIVILPLLNNRGMTIGGTTQPGTTLSVTQATLGRLRTDGGTLQLGGGAGTGAISIIGATTIADNQAATLDLRSAAAVSQTAPLSVGRLLVRGSTVTLANAGNAIATLGPSASTTGGFSFATTTAGTPFAVDAAITSAGALSLANGAGGLSLAVPVTAPGAVTLSALGSITQAAGAGISAPSLTVSVSGPGAAIGLGTEANAIGTVSGLTVAAGGGGIGFRSSGALSITGAVSAPGTIELRSGAGLSLGAAVSSGTGVRLDAAGSIGQTAAGAITAPSLTAAATGPGAAINLASASNAVERLSGASIGPGGGALGFATTTALVIDGPVVVPGAATISAGGGLTQTARVVSASLTVSAGVNGLVLDRADNDFGTLAGASAAGGPVTVRSAGNLDVSGPVSGSSITLASGAALSTLPAATVTTSGTATLDGAAAVALGAAVSGGGGVTVTSGGTIATAGLAASGGTVAVTAPGDVTIGGPVAGATVTLTSGSVLASQATGSITASGMARLQGASVSLAAGVSGATGAIITADTTIATAAVASSGGDVSITAPGNVTIGGPVSGRDVALASGAVLATLPGGGPLFPPAGTVTASGTARLEGTTGVSLGAATSGAAGVVITSSGSVFTTGVSLPGSIGTITSGAGDVRITGASVLTDAPVVAGTGRTIAITADSIAASAALRAPGGTVSLAPRTAGSNIWLGPPLGPGLALSAATLGQVDTGSGTLAIGGATAAQVFQSAPLDLTLRTTTLSLTGTSVVQIATLAVARLAADAGSGPITLAQGGNAIGRLGPVRGGAVSIATGGPLLVEGPVSAGTLVLSVSGAVTQSATASITTTRLSGSAGSLALADTAHAIGTLGPFTATSGGLALATAGPLTLAGNITTPGTLTLNAGGPITADPAARLTAARLTGGASGGTALDAVPHAINALGPWTDAAGGFSLRTTGPLVVTGDVSVAGPLALFVPAALRVDADVAATGPLTVAAGGPVTVTGDVSAGGNASVTALGPMQVGGTMTAGGALLLDATGQLLVTGALDVTGPATLRAGTRMLLAGDVSAGGPTSLTAGSDIAIGGILSSGGVLSVSAGGPVAQGAGSRVTTPLLEGQSRGGTVLAEPGNRIDTLGPWQDPIGGLRLGTTGPLALVGPVTVAGPLSLRSGTAITQAASAPVVAPLLEAEARDGITLTAAANRIDRFGPLTATSGDIGIVNLLPVLLDGPVIAAGTLGIVSGGPIEQRAAVSAARLEASATGGIDLREAANAIRSLGDVVNAGGGPILLATMSDLAIDGRLASPGPIDLRAGGAVSQAAAGRIETPRLSGSSVGGASFGTPTNSVGQLAGWTNLGDGGVRYAGAGGLAVTAPVTAGNGTLAIEVGGPGLVSLGANLSAGTAITVTSFGALSAGPFTYSAPAIEFRSRGAGREMLLGGGTYRASHRLILAATGDMTLSGTLQVQPLTPGSRPTIVVSVRNGAETTGFVRPDSPGLPDLSQPTQIENFDRPTGAARSRLVLGTGGIAAPSSALFLVVDGGSAIGTIDVARLGLIILRGSTDLSGCVNGVCGPNAASLGRTTDASAEARLNNCPVSSPNCLNFSNTVNIVSSQPPGFPAVVTERAGAMLEIPLADVSDEEE
jgi:filamentous hemagglutinin family protein